MAGGEHRSTLVCGESVAVDHHEVDVTGAGGDALRDQRRTFRCHRRQQAGGNLARRYCAWLQPFRRARSLDQRRDFGINDPLTVLVKIPTASDLLAETPGLAQAV